MHKVISVAKNTFTEAIRDRVLFVLLFFALVMILSSFVFASISADQYNKIVKDLGLTSISIIGIVISIFLGVALVQKEIEKKTVYNIFSKPIKRAEFIVGKYLGLCTTLLVITVLMGLILLAIVVYIEIRHEGLVSYYYGGTHYPEFFAAIYFQFLELLIIIGLALVFSSFTTPILSIFFTFFSLAIGKFASDVKLFAEDLQSPVIMFITKFIYIVIPHLDSLDFRYQAVYGGGVEWRVVLFVTLYTVLYSLALVLLAVLIFDRREFK